MTQKTTARPSAAARPVLLTPAFVSVTLAALAYFTADGILIPAVPRYTAGPLGGGDLAVGLVVGAFSASASSCARGPAGSATAGAAGR